MICGSINVIFILEREIEITQLKESQNGIPDSKIQFFQIKY